jgi:tyrosyl-tRNA synthetase
MSIDNLFDIIISSSSEIISSDELKKLLFLKRDIVVKVGFDPTSSDLHLGHLVLIMKLSQLQKIGFKICIIIGDCTALIGDPSGRISSRPILSRDQIFLNYRTYLDQLFKFLDSNLTNVYFNSSWYNFFSSGNFFGLLSMNTISRLLERNDFNYRFKNELPINLNELVYPLLQAYDSVFLDIDIELGGLDQKFNFLLGREIQNKFFQRSQVCILMPLLIGIDGKNKMSKSLCNSININDDFYDIFSKVMSIPDFLMHDYFVYLGFLNSKDYFILFNNSSNLMNLKIDLAYKIVSLIYDIDSAELAKKRFIDVFSRKVIPDDLDPVIFHIEFDSILLFNVLIGLKLILSHSDFKRLLKSGSVKVNNYAVLDRHYILLSNNIYFIRLGKKKFVKIFIKKN